MQRHDCCTLHGHNNLNQWISVSLYDTATFGFTDFTVAASPPAAVIVGTSATSTITVTALNGFSGVVSLADTVPPNLSCGAIAPSSITGSGTATVSCSSTIAATYTLTVTGASETLSYSATATFTSTDFTISATSPPPLYPTHSPTSPISFTPHNYYTGTVSFTDTVPPDLNCRASTPTS